jgi:DNA-binding NtrC family response regulator
MSNPELTTSAPSPVGALALAQPAVRSPDISAKEIVPWLVGSAIAEIERELILQTLARYRGNRTRAAGILGISIRTLRNKIREYQACGLTVTEPGRHPSAGSVRRAATISE